MNFQLWDFSTPSNMFNSNSAQKGPFPSNVSSYFRRPSKVIKPSSRNNSPRTSSRRRMTTTGHAPTRTRSVVDHQRQSMPSLSDSQEMSSRPISWHPNTLDEMSQFQMPMQNMTDFREHLIATPYTTAEINGLVTPMSYPLVDEPQIQELITPLEGLSANEAESGYGYGQDLDMTQYWLSQQAKDSALDFDPSLYPTMMAYQPWYNTNQYMMPNVPTAPTSPSFLPMPDYGAPFNMATMPQPEPEPEHGDDSEELVAMGLYDSPADVQSSSLLFGGGHGMALRRSLKLEDSFEPSAHDAEAEEDDEDAITSEDDDDQPGVSPTTMDVVQQQQQQQLPPTNITVAHEYVQMMDNSYIVNQWNMPVQQNGHGWI